jgi:hypothetical protein
MSKNKTKTKTGNDIAVEYRNIATDAVKMLKSIPFLESSSHFNIPALSSLIVECQTTNLCG